MYFQNADLCLVDAVTDELVDTILDEGVIKHSLVNHHSLDEVVVDTLNIIAVNAISKMISCLIAFPMTL